MRGTLLREKAGGCKCKFHEKWLNVKNDGRAENARRRKTTDNNGVIYKGR